MALLFLPGAWETGAQPPLLLIVREQIKPGGQVAYDRIESEIRRACGRWGCPNAYIGLTEAAAPNAVWWLTAWSSQEELDRAGALYAANPALSARLAPLNARKRAVTDEPMTIPATAVGETAFTLAGARFVMVTPVAKGARTAGALYDLPDGRRIALAPSAAKPPRLAPGSTLLAVQPRWSLPPGAFVSADPAFWADRPRPR
jgi:hypothetical protein